MFFAQQRPASNERELPRHPAFVGFLAACLTVDLGVSCSSVMVGVPFLIPHGRRAFCRAAVTAAACPACNKTSTHTSMPACRSRCTHIRGWQWHCHLPCKNIACVFLKVVSSERLRVKLVGPSVQCLCAGVCLADADFGLMQLQLSLSFRGGVEGGFVVRSSSTFSPYRFLCVGAYSYLSRYHLSLHFLSGSRCVIELVKSQENNFHTTLDLAEDCESPISFLSLSIWKRDTCLYGRRVSTSF